VSAARISALEARLVDVEKRHAEAIARLAGAVADLLIAPEIGTQEIEDHVTTARLLVDALVPEAAARVFEEWERTNDAENESELKRLTEVVRLNRRDRESERAVEHKERARDRSALKAAGAEEAGA
jgi:hypothetical protein